MRTRQEPSGTARNREELFARNRDFVGCTIFAVSFRLHSFVLSKTKILTDMTEGKDLTRCGDRVLSMLIQFLPIFLECETRLTIRFFQMPIHLTARHICLGERCRHHSSRNQGCSGYRSSKPEPISEKWLECVSSCQVTE